MKNIFIVLVILIQAIYANDTYYYQNNQKVVLTPHNSLQRSVGPIDYYTNEKGHTLGVSDKLLVKLYDAKNLENILNDFNLTLEKTLGTQLYLLKAPNKTSTIDIANRLTEKSEVKYAHPDFLKKRMRR